jgi:hypothetical protein
MRKHPLHPVPAPEPFGLEGRGPCVAWWIHDGDLLLPESNEGIDPPPGGVCGAQVSDGPGMTAWVLFHGLQVITTVPEEVHTYWHTAPDDVPDRVPEGGTDIEAPELEGFSPWRIENSRWLAKFRPRHLEGHSHFVIEFYDHIVEVICEELLFGEGEFDIEEVLAKEPRLGFAHLRHAQSMEKSGRLEAALTSYQNYAACAPHVDHTDYATRCATSIRATLQLRPALGAGGGADSIREAIESIGWEGVCPALWNILRDDNAQAHWRTCAEAFLEAVREGSPIGSEVALVGVLHHRFDPTGKQRDELVWEVTRRLFQLNEDFDYDPFKDREVAKQIRQLRRESEA